MVKKYKAEVVSIANHFDNIYSIEFSPKDGSFKYHPGQFLHIAIDPDYDGSGQWPESRCFSMQTSPSSSVIRITFAVKGRFTEALAKSLCSGYQVWLKLPFGNLFTQEHNKNHTVFIAGGTGITPFLSLFTDPSFIEYSNPVLYAGFRSSSYNLYEKELEKASKENSSFKWSVFYEDNGGKLNIKHIFDENNLKSTYFISGPPAMIKSFKESLLESGVHANKILTDDWE
jgi:ferredoxin-NADP reductase